MARAIGLDLGYGFVKVTDGREGFIFPSVVGKGQVGSSLRIGLERPEPTDDLRITIDDQAYFVGNQAIRRSPQAFRGLSATRVEGNLLKVLFLSALSLFCQDPVSSFTVVMGLPPGRMHLAEDLVSQLKGDHRVVRNHDQEPEELTVRIERILVVPQGVGSYWAQVLDPRGQLLDHTQLLQGRIGMVDLGFRTTDLVVIEDGEYVPERSSTIPVGVASAYSEIASRLLSRYGLEKETYALDSAVLAGQINVSGQLVDITEIRDQAFAALATKLAVEFRSQWQLSELYRLLLVGGGSLVLGPYLLPHLPHAAVPSDPITANSRGYWAWAQRLTKAMAAAPGLHESH